MNYDEKIREIHESLVNGQRRQMVEQIDEYGSYDFWKDYARYLSEVYLTKAAMFAHLSDAVISYHHISDR